MSEPKGNWFKRHKILTAILVLVVLAGVAAASGNKEAAKQATTPTASQSATPQAAEATPDKPKWDAAAAYEKVQTGMTKAAVEAAVGQPSKNCSESSIEGYGTTESCTYSGGFGDRGIISVIYSNGAVESKSKVDF